MNWPEVSDPSLMDDPPCKFNVFHLAVGDSVWNDTDEEICLPVEGWLGAVEGAVDANLNRFEVTL